MSRSVGYLVILGTALAVSGTARADIYFDPPKEAEIQAFRQQYEAKLKEEPTPNLSMELLKQSDTLARFLVYRMTKKQEYHSKPGDMAGLVRQCEVALTRALPPEAVNVPLGQAFVKKMLEALAQVLAPPDQLPITRVNAARVLARLASVSGLPETSDVLVKLITDPYKGDGARYWAFRGLRGLYEKNPKPPTGERRQKAVEALVQFIEKLSKVTAETPIEELDGIRIVRREAIRALGVIRDPGVAKKKGSEAALVLVRILRGDKEVIPEPRLDERVEAAVGLANLRPDAGADYQAGYAIANVGQFLVEFLSLWGARNREISREPWKVYCARMEESLQELAVALPGDATVKGVVPAAVALLSGIRANKTTTSITELSDALKKTSPPASIYKTDPMSVFKPKEGN